MKNVREMIKLVVRDLFNSGFMEDGVGGDDLVVEEDGDGFCVSVFKDLESVAKFSGKVGFDGLKLLHVEAVAGAIGMETSLREDGIGVTVYRSDVASATINFPTVYARRDAVGGGETGNAEGCRGGFPRGSKEPLVLGRARLHLELRYRLADARLADARLADAKAADAEEESPVATAHALSAVGLRVGQFMTSLKFLPKFKKTRKNDLRPSLLELCDLLDSVALAGGGSPPVGVEICDMTDKDYEVRISFKDEHSLLMARSFLEERRLAVRQGVCSRTLFTSVVRVG